MVRKLDDNSLLVFEPTLREVEFLLNLFDEIHWYGFETGANGSNLYRSPVSKRIVVHTLPKAVGGDSLLKKLRLLPRFPLMSLKILRLMSNYSYIHTRGPSVPALVAIILSRWFTAKKIWHKYAGNWGQIHPPFSYKWQRTLLKESVHPVTINGNWHDSNAMIMTFENPCFSESELASARQREKLFDCKEWHVLFVGRWEREKGIHHVLASARLLPKAITWHLVGEGKDKEWVKELASDLTNVHLVGSVNREKLNDLYARCHFFVLPTIASEGFPKVISEAAGFGCIPIVSSVSSIAQYVTSQFGYILPQCNEIAVRDALQTLMADKHLLEKSKQARTFASLFTYERYVQRVRQEIFQLS